ncbi:MAG TPA: hypothetical protein VMY76_01550 [Gemmatimonadales bacterium]|nr:hypothetical protein [Gemmatimonadales bacterium]
MPTSESTRTSRAAALVLLLAAAGCGQDESPVAPEARPADASPAVAAAVAPLAFVQVSTGINHSCGVTADDRAYCWGYNWKGEVGDGSTTLRRAPRAVAGGLRFRFVSAGHSFTCGLTTDDRAYCWGSNENGELGIGSTALTQLTPRQVSGSRRYRQLRSGSNYACAVTLADVAFCWGDNFYGQLGIGLASGTNAPVQVKTGGLVFRRVLAGGGHTCGLTADNKAWCWGRNDFGQVGDGARGNSLAPLPVAGGLTFAQISAGTLHTCGVTTDNRAYCWGRNAAGGVGDGTQFVERDAPVAVAGALRFSGVSAGYEHSCGVTLAKAVYCWGLNGDGQQGDNTKGNVRLSPMPVLGGLRFSSMGGMSFGPHNCAVTTENRAYCWGNNREGEVGDNTERWRRLVPTAVAGPS